MRHTHTHTHIKNLTDVKVKLSLRSPDASKEKSKFELDNTINKGLKGIGSNAGLSCRCGANMQSQVAIYHAMWQAEREGGVPSRGLSDAYSERN